jgi:hypothetical protein
MGNLERAYRKGREIVKGSGKEEARGRTVLVKTL